MKLYWFATGALTTAIGIAVGDAVGGAWSWVAIVATGFILGFLAFEVEWRWSHRAGSRP